MVYGVSGHTVDYFTDSIQCLYSELCHTCLICSELFKRTTSQTQGASDNPVHKGERQNQEEEDPGELIGWTEMFSKELTTSGRRNSRPVLHRNQLWPWECCTQQFLPVSKQMLYMTLMDGLSFRYCVGALDRSTGVMTLHKTELVTLNPYIPGM